MNRQEDKQISDDSGSERLQEEEKQQEEQGGYFARPTSSMLEDDDDNCDETTRGLGSRQVSAIARQAREAAVEHVVTGDFDSFEQEATSIEPEQQQYVSSVDETAMALTGNKSESLEKQSINAAEHVEKEPSSTLGQSTEPEKELRDKLELRSKVDDKVDESNIPTKQTQEKAKLVDAEAKGVVAEENTRLGGESAGSDFPEGIAPPSFPARNARHQQGPGAYSLSPAHPPRRVGTENDTVVSDNESSRSMPSIEPLLESKQSQTILLEATLVESNRQVTSEPNNSVSGPSEPIPVMSSAVVEAKEVNLERDDVVGIRKRHLVIGLVCTVCVGIVIGVVFGTGNNDDGTKDIVVPSTESTFAPTSAPTSAPSPLPLKDFRDTLPEFSKKSLENGESPQWEALMWLAAVPDLPNYAIERQTQLFALATLYYATNGERWLASDGWVEYGVSECLWFANKGDVDNLCFPDTEIIQSITLIDVGLKGTIPEEISLLKQLEVLSFFAQDDQNYLAGTIPTFLVNMTTLTWLDLGKNDLSGQLPTGLDSLSRLTVLDLGGQGGIVEGELPVYAFESWRDLTVLGFNGCNFLPRNFPSEIAYLTKLYDLSLADTNLEGSLIDSVASLKNLEILILSNNFFVGEIPRSWSGLTKLIDLYLDGNGLTGQLPEEISEMTFLELLVLDNNLFDGKLPRSWASLVFLMELYINDNNLTGQLPQEIAEMSSLEILWLENNYFSGTLPASWGALRFLVELDLSNNNLSGPLPINLANCENLEYLSLFGNNFNGTVPTSWGTLDWLEFLDLRENNLSGIIPIELCSLVDSTSLEILVDCDKVDCDCCDCSGTRSPTSPTTPPPSLPPTSRPSFGTSAPTWDPVIESFRGALPAYTVPSLQDPTSPQSQALAWLTNNTNLEQYSDIRLTQRFALATLYYSTDGDRWTDKEGWLSDADECTWSTNDPLGCENQIMLYLLLNERRLRGTLPPEIGMMSLLVELDLGANQIKGDIPTTIGLLDNLKGLYMAENRLDGTVPTEIGDLTQLEYLDIDFNSLRGSIPSQLSQLTLLFGLWLSVNRLTGLLPDSLSALSNLQHLELSENSFRGGLPASWSSLSQLQELYLYLAGIGGNIPNELWGAFSEIWHFGIAENDFVGTIGANIGFLTNVAVFNIYSNAFLGPIPTEIGLMQNASFIDLSDNLLTGAIPPELALIETLEELDVSFNLLAGTVPSQLCDRVTNDGVELIIDCDLVQCTCGCICA